MSGIEVHVRIRPTESDDGASGPVWSASESVLFVTNKPEQRFGFGKVHGAAATNSSVYQSIEPLVNAALEGRRVTLMAYGQTGSGKTHSMSGSWSPPGTSRSKSPTPNQLDDPGIMYRATAQLLALASQKGDAHIFGSCVEIYNEALRDLLATATPSVTDLQLRDAPDGSGAVMFAHESLPIRSLQDFYAMLKRAESNRRYGATDCNEHSSRSHFLLTLEIVSADGNPSGSLKSSLTFVDLAGAESASRANTEGQSLREGGFINKSLLSLGNVVDAIVDRKEHIPYRESKLTRVLRPCLGGKGLTFILCCVNPSGQNYDQTLNALKFAQRAMRIQNDTTLTLNMPPLSSLAVASMITRLGESSTVAAEQAYQRGVAEAFLAARDSMGPIVQEMDQATEAAAVQLRDLNVELLAAERLNALRRLQEGDLVVTEAHRRKEELQSRQQQLLDRRNQLQEELSAAETRDRESSARFQATRDETNRILAAQASAANDALLQAAGGRWSQEVQMRNSGSLGHCGWTELDIAVATERREYEELLLDYTMGLAAISEHWVLTYPRNQATTQQVQQRHAAAMNNHESAVGTFLPSHVMRETIRQQKLNLQKAQRDVTDLEDAVRVLRSELAGPEGEEGSLNLGEIDGYVGEEGSTAPNATETAVQEQSPVPTGGAPVATQSSEALQNKIVRLSMEMAHMDQQQALPSAFFTALAVRPSNNFIANATNPSNVLDAVQRCLGSFVDPTTTAVAGPQRSSSAHAKENLSLVSLHSQASSGPGGDHSGTMVRSTGGQARMNGTVAAPRPQTAGAAKHSHGPVQRYTDHNMRVTSPTSMPPPPTRAMIEDKPGPVRGGRGRGRGVVRQSPPPEEPVVETKAKKASTTAEPASLHGLVTSDKKAAMESPMSPTLGEAGTSLFNLFGESPTVTPQATKKATSRARPRTLMSPKPASVAAPSGASSGTKKSSRKRSRSEAAGSDTTPGFSPSPYDNVVGIAARRKLEHAEARPAAQKALFYYY